MEADRATAMELVVIWECSSSCLCFPNRATWTIRETAVLRQRAMLPNIIMDIINSKTKIQNSRPKTAMEEHSECFSLASPPH
ncbi:hypothetical protein MUK42_31983 [Musa troglodytarum]|uniref:Uncharacterized protein n=1 Tax=Musa troglodytarum TaxID=320322 RepID=A0A9E7JYH7_9LILI|nr:hypothetical protein MUK42_31983 [Musa troglodytarum]